MASLVIYPLVKGKHANNYTQQELVSSNSDSHMQDVMHQESWAEANKMELNAEKTNETWIYLKKTTASAMLLSINDMELKWWCQ